jgi:hypothetical protein
MLHGSSRGNAVDLRKIKNEKRKMKNEKLKKKEFLSIIVGPFFLSFFSAAGVNKHVRRTQLPF